MGFDLKDYETVQERLAKFWIDHGARPGQISIETEMVSYSGDEIIFKATIKVTEPFRLVTGWAQETKGSSPVNKTSWVENCETSAIGRALANLGYATKERPSQEEMAKATPYQAGRPFGAKITDNPLPEGPFASPEQQSAIVDYFAAAEQDLDARLKTLGLSSVTNLPAETAAKWIEHFKKLDTERATA